MLDGGRFLKFGSKRHQVKSRIIAIGVVLIAALSFVAIDAAEKIQAFSGVRTAQRLQVFADSFLQTLDPNQRLIALKTFDDASRTDWHFLSKPKRKGLAIKDMNDAQRTAALRLVRAATSEAGYRCVDAIRRLESINGELEGPDRLRPRDPDAYYLTIFGEPSALGSWAISFEGHHLSLNFVCRGGVVVDSTPQFFGSNPATVADDYRGPLPPGTRVLADIEDAGFELIGLMTPAMLKKVVIAPVAPLETRFAGEPQAAVEARRRGVAYRDLNLPQQQTLQRLVGLYTDMADQQIAADRFNQIEFAGWEDVHFAWLGATRPGVGHGYRVRGETFLIEMINNQPDALGNPANHVHCVLRDLTGDFDLPGIRDSVSSNPSDSSK